MADALRVVLDSAHLDALFDAISALLEHVPEALRDHLVDLLPDLLLEHSVGGLLAAPIAGDDVVRLEFSFGRASELFAAALRAAQLNLICGHGGPYAL